MSVSENMVDKWLHFSYHMQDEKINDLRAPSGIFIINNIPIIEFTSRL